MCPHCICKWDNCGACVTDGVAFSNHHQALSKDWDKHVHKSPYAINHIHTLQTHSYTYTHLLSHRLTHSLKLRIWGCALEPDHKVTLDHRFSPIRFNSLQYRELQRFSMSLLSTYKCAADFMWLTPVLFSWTKRFPRIQCTWTSLHCISGSLWGKFFGRKGG